MVDRYTELSELDDYQLENSDQDLRGRALRTYDGRRLGTIQRMLVDPERQHVAALVLEDGQGVPVEDIEIRDGEAYIDAVGGIPVLQTAPSGAYGGEKSRGGSPPRDLAHRTR